MHFATDGRTAAIPRESIRPPRDYTKPSGDSYAGFDCLDADKWAAPQNWAGLNARHVT